VLILKFCKIVVAEGCPEVQQPLRPLVLKFSKWKFSMVVLAFRALENKDLMLLLLAWQWDP
jgi:hypothetical protein